MAPQPSSRWYTPLFNAFQSLFSCEIPTRAHAQSVDQDEWIAEAQAELDRGRAIACHCFAGKGRTGTAIASFLIKHLQTPPVEYVHEKALQISLVLSDCH